MPINESLNLSVLFGGSVKATASATIVDTSRPDYEYILVPSNPSNTAIAEIDVPTYTITANKTTLNEGDSVVFTLTTTMLDAGTSVPYTISGVSVSDINLSSLTGNFTTDAAGKATLTITTVADNITETNETLTITLNGKTVSKSVLINDTSQAPSYSVGWYSDINGNTNINSTNEGTTAHLVVKTTNVANGTNLTFSLGGTGINNSDITSGILTGTITINNNIGYVSLPFVNDLTTEGNESLVATVKNGSTTVGTSNLVINDTSRAPTYTLSSNITNVNEGSNVVITLTTTNVTNGTIVPYVITGVALADITLNSLSGNFTVNNNVATLIIPIVADNLTEGNETLVITLTGKNIAKSVIINDTSVLVEVKTATFTSNYNRYTYKTSKPYGQGDVTAWEYIVAYGLLNRDAFTAVNNRAYVGNLSLSQIGTPGSVTLTIGGVTHTLRWAFSLFDLYEEQGEGASGGVDAYLDFPSDVIKSITVRSVDNGGTYTATFVPIGNNGQGFIARNSTITSEWYSHAGPVTLEVLSWTK